jgi:DNA-binding MarR family transcriptional regulator
MLNGINDMAKNTEHARMREDAEKLADIFTVLQRCFLSNLSRELSRGHVSFPQYFLLGYLGQQKSLSMSEIAARMSHTTAAATGLVDRLVKPGYVRRRSARDDRRKILVQVTKKGAGLVERIHEDMVGNLIKLMGQLTPGEQRAWVKIYEKIFDYCQKK